MSLCQAVDDADVPRMERLIAAGADVNAKGREGMSLLYWAFHIDDDPGPFACLLRHGADPNVIASLDGDRWTAIVMPGNAVVHLVSQMGYNRLYKEVFDLGGDPNLRCDDLLFVGATPLHMVLAGRPPDAAERLRLLIAKNADLDSQDDRGFTFVRLAVGRGTESGYQLALIALENGADWRRSYTDQDKRLRLIHYLAKNSEGIEDGAGEKRQQFDAVVRWLEERGESLEVARDELQSGEVQIAPTD